MSPRLQCLCVDAAQPGVLGRWWADLLQWRVARAERLGATRVDVGPTEDSTWTVLADPEGNEFCIPRALTTVDQA